MSKSNISLRPKQTAEFLGVGHVTLWRWSRERGDFPKAIRLSSRCTVFQLDQLVAWRDAKVGK